MKLLLLASAVAGTFALTLPEAPSTQDPQDVQGQMQKAAKFTQPGKHHKVLERFLGKWETTSSFVMGGRKMGNEKGTAEFSWLIEGRWLQSRMDGKIMGMPLQAHTWLGYDNFKQSFVSTRVSSMDTAMTHAEGDLTQDGKALITYGTLDEYLTGEHDKMVKYVWRFVSDDEMALEVHDLPIGEENTEVLHVAYKRAK